MVLAYEPQFYFCLVNFTTEGLKEDSVNIGDSFRIGSAKIIATQPRMPCYKLGIKFGRMDIIKQFLVSGRPGIYFRVLQEGTVEAGDSIKFLYKDKNNITIKDIVRIYLQSGDIEEMHRIMKVKALPSGWRDHFR